MALDPMMEDAGSMPMDDGAAEAEAPAGFCVELRVLADGTFEVAGPEPLDEDYSDEPGQPAASLGEAMKMMMALIKSAQPDAGESADDQMAAGFNAARGQIA